MSSETALQIAAHLLKIQAVRLSPQKPFTWASGILSPIYCDNRLTLSYPDTRSLICDGLVGLIKKEFPGAGGIAGVATAGIPHGMLVADRLSLPFLYIRSKPKDHGMTNMIEGRIEPGKEYVVVEDLVSTGMSSLAAVKALRDAGGKIGGLISVFSYGFEEAKQAFADAGVKWTSLLTYDELLPVAVSGGHVSESELLTLQEWRKNPRMWGKPPVA